MTSRSGGGLAARWNAFWYTPASAVNLAAARIIVAAHALWILGSRDLPAVSGVPAVFWAGVPAGDRWRFLLIPGHLSLEVALEWATVVALVAAIAGLWPRLACFAAGLLLYHLAPLETMIWTPNPYERGFTVSVIALLALSFSRCGDALCLVGRRTGTPAPSSDYRWPLQLVQLVLCQVYFIAGYAKIYRAGLGWASSSNMRSWLLAFAQEDQVSSVRHLTFWLADHPFICGVMAVAGLSLDLGLITVMIWPRLRAWLISAVLLFHLGVVLTMGIVFLNIPQLLIFVNWDGLRSRRTRAAWAVAGARPEESA